MYNEIHRALQSTSIMLTDNRLLTAPFFFFFKLSTHVTDPWINSPVTNLCQEHLDGLPDL